jgi:hypothetical protein
VISQNVGLTYITIENPWTIWCASFSFTNFKSKEQKVSNLEWFLISKKIYVQIKMILHCELEVKPIWTIIVLNGWPYKRFNIIGPPTQSALILSRYVKINCSTTWNSWNSISSICTTKHYAYMIKLAFLSNDYTHSPWVYNISMLNY